MNPLINEAIDTARAFFRENANPNNVEKYKYYFKEGYDAFGLDMSTWNIIKKRIIDEYIKKIGIDGVFEMSKQLMTSDKYEEISLCIVSVEHYKKIYKPEHLTKIEEWFKGGIKNWAHCDYLSGDVISYFLVKGIVPLERLSSWLDSSIKWQRRSVPVSMLKLLKSDTDVKIFLDFLRPLMLDTERVVHQGVGWFLREAWKKYPEEVEQFLLEWKDVSPRLIFQYATEKMTKENKERFRKTKPLKK
jgi:3-methyladenine DNA glycosylase AlkD